MLSTVSRSIRTRLLRVPRDLSSRRRRTTPVPVFVDRPPPEQRRLGGHPTRSSPQPVRKESAERSPAVVVSRQLPTSKGQVSRVTRQEVAGQQPSPPSTSGSSWSAPTICRISSAWAASLTRPLPSSRRRSGPASTSWSPAPRRQATPPIPRTAAVESVGGCDVLGQLRPCPHPRPSIGPRCPRYCPSWGLPSLSRHGPKPIAGMRQPAGAEVVVGAHLGRQPRVDRVRGTRDSSSVARRSAFAFLEVWQRAGHFLVDGCTRARTNPGYVGASKR
jgi:hypothetical protein